MFSERRVAQMAAYLLHKRGNRMAHLKLMKLLYLADREAMDRYGVPISGDCMVSMDHGPVLSMTLNLIDGDVESKLDGWKKWISDKEDNEVALACRVDREILDELSNADIEVIDSIWEEFGHMSRWEIRDYVHEHCAEWNDPHGSSTPIEYKDVLIAVGKSEDQAEFLSSRIDSKVKLDRVLEIL